MRKHYFAAKGHRYTVRVEIVPNLSRSEEGIASLDFNITIRDMSPENCGKRYTLERQVRYNSPNYLNKESLTTKRCERYLFMKVSPADTNDWKGYVDYVAQQNLSGEQLLLFPDSERPRLTTNLRLGEIRLLEERGILKGLFGRNPIAAVA